MPKRILSLIFVLFSGIFIITTSISAMAKQETCPVGNGWTKVNSDDLSSYPVQGAANYCFKAGSEDSKGCQGGVFTSWPQPEGTCGLSHWAYQIVIASHSPTPSPVVSSSPSVSPIPRVSPRPSVMPSPSVRPSPSPSPVASHSISPSPKVNPSPVVTPTTLPYPTPSPTPNVTVVPQKVETIERVEQRSTVQSTRIDPELNTNTQYPVGNK